MSGGVSRTKVLSSLIWVYLETITAQAVSFIVSIVLARLLEPSYYGTIALILVFINIANVFVTSGFTAALVQKKDSDILDYNTVFWFNFVLSVFFYIVLFLCAPYIADFYSNAILINLIRVLALRIPLAAVNSVQLAYVSNKMVFKKSFLTNSGGAIISGVVAIILALLGYGIWVLVFQSLANIVFSTLLMCFVVEWKPKMEFSFERLITHVSFGWKILVTGLMFSAYNELRAIIIGKKYSAADLAYYDRGNSFPKLIGTNIDVTINRVLFPALSKSQDDMARMALGSRRAAKTSAYIMTPILFGLAVLAKPLVALLLTEKWLPCVPYMQVMCLVWWLQPTQSCSIQAVKAIGRSDLYLNIEIISKVTGVLLILAAIKCFNTPFSIAVTMLISQFVAMLTYGSFVSKYIGYRLREQFADLLLPAAISCFICICVYFISFDVGNIIIKLSLQVVLGFLIYLVISYALRVEEFFYLLGIFKKGKK